MDTKQWYRRIPNVSVLLEKEEIKALIREFGREAVVDSLREELEHLRRIIGEQQESEQTAEDETFFARHMQEQLEHLIERTEQRVRALHEPNMRSVINGTGTILHTNLGRAPLSRKHAEHVAAVAAGYSNLEYDLQEGKRGERYFHFEKLLCRITGAEAAMAVNNNAASVLLILSTLAKGGEVITSRGELVEIGGKFRIPDVMEQSGAILREIGTTNKTHPEDYENAINENTKGILKVHTSNYRIIGFTQSVEVEELAALAKKHELPLIEDLGSGILIDLEKYGLPCEPTIQSSVKAGADVVCFSGDKLLGGPQAGIIVGRKKYIDQMKKNPLTRAIRIDKLTACALEAVLMEYLSEEKAVQNIPVLEMMVRPEEKVRAQAEKLVSELKREAFPADISLVQCSAQIGGGSLPTVEIKSWGAAIRPRKISVTRLEQRLRSLLVPVIGRIVEDRLILDRRTIRSGQETLLVQQLKEYQVFENDRKQG